MTRWPRRTSARGSAADTSARPPVFMKGVISEVTKATASGGTLPAAEARPAGHSGDDGDELVRVDRLGEVDLIAGGEDAAAVVGPGMRGQGHRGNGAALIGRQRAHAREQREPVFSRHAD